MDAAAKSALASAEDPMIVDAPASLPDAPQDPWATVRELALKQLDRFMSLEPRVLRGDDPDAIHDLRVASRRLQQILDLLYPHPHGEVRKLRRRIRRSRRALGDVRNADVQLARVRTILARKRTARREAWESLRDFLLAERSENFARALRRLSKQRLTVVYIRLKDILAQTEAKPVPHTAGAAMEGDDAQPNQFEERLGVSLASVWQGFEAQVAASHRDPQSSVIHAVRIAAKRLRYLVEVLHEFHVEGSAETLAWLRGVQELLGNWHDLEVLEQMMVAMVGRPAFLRENLGVAMEVEKLILRNRANKGKFREEYFRQTLEGADFQQVKNWAENLELKIDN
jgi:CHAD domain-containing protein